MMKNEFLFCRERTFCSNIIEKKIKNYFCVSLVFTMDQVSVEDSKHLEISIVSFFLRTSTIHILVIVVDENKINHSHNISKKRV
jgi:hypothetical protein